MLRIGFGPDDLGRTRFLPEPAPLVELKLALMMVVRHSTDPALDRWQRAQRRALPSAALPVLDLISPFAGPAFIDPPLPELGAALMHVASSPGAAVRRDLARVFASRSEGMPPWLADLAREDRGARRVLTDALQAAYDVVVDPAWPLVRARHHAELSERGRDVAVLGVETALARAFPGARWTGRVLEIPAGYQREVSLNGRGLDLLPSAHWVGPPLLADLPDQPVRPVLLVYGCVGKVVTPDTAPNDALAGLLGHTRAAVLRGLLHGENSTGAIARRLDLSPASVSEHIRALREAGLATSTRQGRTVDHHPTALGRSLLDVNATRQPRLL